METENDKIRFLNAYSQTYIKEEVWMEHFVRKLDPFRRFLEVSAQCNGHIINYANVSRDVGADEKTIKQYFAILEDTLLGFYLEPFHHSFRKRLSQKPKFYYFDIGVKNSLSRTLSIPVQESTSSYGYAFEHFIILEIFKVSNYFFPEYKFSYFKTKDDAEIDLVVERPGEKILFIEIKSTTNVYKEQLTSFLQLAKDFGDCEAICLSRDMRCKKLDNIIVYPWKDGIVKYFLPSDCYNT